MNTGYQCARCNRTYSLASDQPSDTENIKTAVRYCQDPRCQRERQIEAGELVVIAKPVPQDIQNLGPDAIAAIRLCKTSDLILTLAHPEGAAESIADLASRSGMTLVDPEPFWKEIAAEIDRRIPVPDPRIGKLCRPAVGARPMRVVSVEPGGLLRCRVDGGPREDVDMRVDPDAIAPGDWLDG